MTRVLPIFIVLLAGCGEPRPASSGDSPAAFPHPEGYADTHGEAAELLDSCTTCHAVDPPEPDTAVVTDSAPPEEPAIPACRSCHAAYPHRRDFRDEHGAAWSADEYACTGCHGSAGDRDPSTAPADTCTGCHATYPHPSNQTSAREHGADVVTRGGDTACAGCHEASSCQGCHASYPHGDDHLAAHGEAYAEGSCGGNCHDGAQQGAPGEVLCSSCHEEGLP